MYKNHCLNFVYLDENKELPEEDPEIFWSIIWQNSRRRQLPGPDPELHHGPALLPGWRRGPHGVPGVKVRQEPVLGEFPVTPGPEGGLLHSAHAPGHLQHHQQDLQPRREQEPHRQEERDIFSSRVRAGAKHEARHRSWQPTAESPELQPPGRGGHVCQTRAAEVSEECDTVS